MKREEADILFKRDSDDKLIFNPIDESQAKFLFIQYKDRLRFLREEKTSLEETGDLLLGKVETRAQMSNLIKIEIFKRHLGSERETFESIRNWFTQRNINEPDSPGEKLEKEQQKKRIDKYIKMVRQKVKKEIVSAKGEKNEGEIIVSSKDKIKDKTPEELIKGEKSKRWTNKDDFELCDLLSNNKYVPTPEEESRKKNKTFLSNRTKWWDRPKRKYREKFVNIIEELESQIQMELTEFRKILNVKSDYHRKALLNAFKYAVNHPDGNLYEKANKRKVSIKNTRKGKILLLD